MENNRPNRPDHQGLEEKPSEKDIAKDTADALGGNVPQLGECSEGVPGYDGSS